MICCFFILLFVDVCAGLGQLVELNMPGCWLRSCQRASSSSALAPQGLVVTPPLLLCIWHLSRRLSSFQMLDFISGG